MIPVLIVDDDNLVRRGLISSMPWDSFGMKVVGEAANGEKALEFMASHRVDLLLTDLAMPVMSGIELIRIVRERYPDVAVAVLTLHQDFEYIQEALRLGAIDYIAKVQLEQERFGEVLERIRSRIMTEKSKRSEKTISATRYLYSGNYAYALVALHEQPEPVDFQPESGLGGCWVMENDPCVRVWMPGRNEDHPDSGELPPYPVGIQVSHWRMVRVCLAAGELLAELQQLLGQYRQRAFFYVCDGREPHPIDISLEELRSEPSRSGQREIEDAKELLHSFRWLHDKESFEELKDCLFALRLPIAKLMQILYGCTVEWNRIFRSVTQFRATLPDKFVCWREAAEWMNAFQETAQSVSGRLQLSREVSGSIMAAIKIVHDELEQPLFAIDVAKRVHLSRSYFNQVFKEIVGHSFNEYLRQTRIDKAREYLVQTIKPIQWVAEQSGYSDEKYFSRTFREQTGMLPSEYRQRHRQGE
ncbi:response regulator [Cohnella thailandensis]|uniref:Response regulator n=1 Tax=Cohnella thailandensis TaxID=557557 RepID=A0A841T0S2_9BACL|nr:response regulator [Cohnella thailandensis]MBB6637142.1 response regulator [Cohnella thailandensis]MBP1977040.1 two-component system response regulator YesN [Cohnella thailandensis]